MVFAALAVAKLLSILIVMSYHAHIPVYVQSHNFCIEPLILHWFPLLPLEGISKQLR
ncbi:hypothetical protein OROHE_000305 [Orobanche hederae]